MWFPGRNLAFACGDFGKRLESVRVHGILIMPEVIIRFEKVIIMKLGKTVKLTGTALLMGLMLAGCTSGGGAAEPKEVTHACTVDFDGMKAEITLTGPSEDEPVKSIVMKINMPADFFGMEDLSSVNDEMIEVIKPALATQLKVDESKIEVNKTDEALDIIVQMDGEELEAMMELGDNASMTMKEMVDSMKEEGDAECS